jgi:hypothetical protein
MRVFGSPCGCDFFMNIWQKGSAQWVSAWSGNAEAGRPRDVLMVSLAQAAHCNTCAFRISCPIEQDRVGVILPLEAPYLSLTEGSLSSSLVRLGVNRIPYFGLGSGCGAHINIDVAGANGSVILGTLNVVLD